MFRYHAQTRCLRRSHLLPEFPLDERDLMHFFVVDRTVAEIAPLTKQLSSEGGLVGFDVV